MSPQYELTPKTTNESLPTPEVPKDNMHVKCFAETTAYINA